MILIYIINMLGLRHMKSRGEQKRYCERESLRKQLSVTRL